MNCNRCNRLLVARDATIVDAQDSAARIELHCECGAVYSSFLDNDSWIYGLAGDRTPGRIVTRCWCRTAQGIVRWLDVNDYNDCEFGVGPREWMYRIPLHDRRPWGMEMSGMVHLGQWLHDLPFKQWLEATPAEYGTENE